MSRFVTVPSGDYKVKVQSGGEIKLDTGVGVGNTRVTGNLIVEGTQTQVTSNELTVKDNIIEVNSGENGVGVTLNQAGIRVDRGRLVDVQMLFDEQLQWNDPDSQTTRNGAFTFVDVNGALLGLRTNSISTGGALYFQPGGSGSLRIIKSTYETYVTDDNDIPNKKYVDTEIVNQINSLAPVFIGHSDTEVRVADSTGGANPVSQITMSVDGVVKAKMNGNSFEMYNTTVDIGQIRIEDNIISNTVSNGDLKLEAPGTGAVKVTDSFVIKQTPGTLDPATDPAVDTDGVKLYSKVPAGGDTGLYYVNTNDAYGEMISKNRSMVLSMVL